MPLQDLHRAIGPAEALRLVGVQRIRHDALAVGARIIDRLPAFLEQPQAQFRILGDAPFGPAADSLQRRFAYHGHGAVLDDRVVVVTLHHADLEEAGIFPVAGLLEAALFLVVIILRRLHQADGRVLEMRHHVVQPVGRHDVVAVDDGHHLGIRGGLLHGEIQGARLEAGPGAQMKEAEPVTQRLAMDLDRTPDRLVLGVVVDHQHFEIRIIELGQRVQRLLQHLRRLVVARHMDRHLGQARHVGSGDARQRHPAVLAPDHVDQLDHVAGDGGEQQHLQHDENSPGGNLAGAQIAHGRDQHGQRQRRAGSLEGGGEDDTAGQPQLGARTQIDDGRNQAKHDRDGGPERPVGQFGHRILPGEFRLAVSVVQAPIGADDAFLADLPGLVERLDDVVVELVDARDIHPFADEARLVDERRLGGAHLLAGTRPAHLGDDNRLVGIELAQLGVALQRVLDGHLDRHAFPVGQQLHGDEIDSLDQLGMLVPDVPGLRRGDAHRGVHLHLTDEIDHLRHGHFGAQQRLVADNDAGHVAVLPDDADQIGDLALVARLVAADPGAGHDAQAEFAGHRRDAVMAVAGGVGADARGLLRDQFQVAADFLRRRALGQRPLVAPIGAEGHAGDDAVGIHGRARPVDGAPDRDIRQNNKPDDQQIRPTQHDKCRFIVRKLPDST